MFSRAVQTRVQELIGNGRHVIVAGDVNVVANEIDHCNPELDKKERNIIDFCDTPARQWFHSFLVPKGEMIDTFRYFHPNAAKVFTVWNTRLNSRPTNYGTRIDYMLVDQKLISWIQDSFVLSDVMGSDHCPIGLVFKSELDGDRLSDLIIVPNKPPRLCTCYWSNYPGKQKKINFPLSKTKTSALQVTGKTPIMNKPSSNKRKDSTLPIKPAKQQQLMKYFQSSLTVAQTEIANNPNAATTQESNSNTEPKSSLTKWNAIFQKQTIPNCYHNEPCIELMSKRPASKGEYFYQCNRPTGDPPEGRCQFFQWKRKSFAAKFFSKNQKH